MTRLRLRHAVLACALLLSFGVARASLINTTAIADWSQFSVTAMDIGFGMPSVTWSSQDTTVSFQIFAQDGVTSGSTSQFGTINNWAVAMSATGSLLNSGASAIGSATTLSAQSGSQANSGFTSSSASRGGSFTVSGSGLLVFSVPYQIIANAALTAGGDSASATSMLSISASSFGFGQSSSGMESVSADLFASFAGDIQALDMAGMLFASLSVQDGASGVFSINASTNTNSFFSSNPSVVPVPGAAWFLGSALLGLAALARRKQAS